MTSSAGMRMRRPQLSKMKAALGDAAAYQYATIYAQWGNRTEGARMARDGDAAARLGPAIYFKTDPLLDPFAKSRAFRRSSGS